MVAGRKVLGSRRGRDGGKGAKFSEVKPAVGTESSEKVPEGPQSRKWGDSSGRRGALPTQSVRRGRGQREVMQAPERRFQSDSNPRPKRTRAVPPGPATRPCLSLPSYPVSLRSLRCTPRYPKRCPIWRPSSPAPPAAEQRPRPPTNERSGGPRGARPRRVRRASLATSTKEARPHPFPGQPGWATPEENYNSRRASGRAVLHPPVALTPKPRGRCIFISLLLSAWLE